MDGAVIMHDRQNIFTGLEIGTDTVKVVFAGVGDDSSLRIIGFDEEPSVKMRKGEVLDTPQIVIEQAAIALARACAMAGLKAAPGQFAVVLSGPFVTSGITVKKVELPPSQPITSDVMEALMRQSCEDVRNMPNGDELLDTTVNRCFHLKDREFVFNPVGQYSPELTVETQYFMAEPYAVKLFADVVKSVIGKRDFPTYVYAPLAISSAVVRPQSSSDVQGLVIELGAGMTSIAMPTATGHLVCEQIGVGCDHIANDLDIALDLQDIDTARRLVREMSNMRISALTTHDGKYRSVKINRSGGRQPAEFPCEAVEMVIEARLDEIFAVVRERLEAAKAMPFLGSSVLLSGGGALIPGVGEIARRHLNRPVHTAAAYDVTDMTGLFTPGPRWNMVLGAIRAADREKRIMRAARPYNSLWQMLHNFFYGIFYENND